MSFQRKKRDELAKNQASPANMKSETAPDFTLQAKNHPVVPSTGVEGQMDTVPSQDNALLFGLETSGASATTASQDNIRQGGIAASEQMAQTDQQRVLQYAAVFTQVGNRFGLPPALLAAICSRETRGGARLGSNGRGLDDSNGFGIMQVDVQFHDTTGGPASVEHVTQAAQILHKNWTDAIDKFPDWTLAQQLRGAVAAYNMGIDNVRTWGGMDGGTTGDDYSSDVWARARYYASLRAFGAHTALLNQAASASLPSTGGIS